MKSNNYDFPLDLESENSVSLIIEQIKPRSIVLEFGPASGRMTKYLTEELLCSVYIVEIDEVAFEKSIQFAMDGICDDIEAFKWVDKFIDLKFDYIIFADVLEHLMEPRVVLEKAQSMLTNLGKVIVSVPNIAHNYIILDLINNKFNYSERGILDETHMKFFTYYSLHQLFSDADLNVIVENYVKLECDDQIIDNIYNEETAYKYQLLGKREFANVYQFVFTAMHKSAYINHINEIETRKYNASESDGVSLLQSLFIDDGDGFREELKISKRLNLISNKFHFSADLTDQESLESLRFDPCEYASKIRIDEIKSNIEIQIEAVNNTNVENGYDVFMHADPVYHIKCINYNDLKGIEITGEIIRINTYDMFQYYNSIVKNTNIEFENLNENMNQVSLRNNELSQEVNDFKSAIMKIALGTEQISIYNHELKQEIEEKNVLINDYKAEINGLRIEKDGLRVELEDSNIKKEQYYHERNDLQIEASGNRDEVVKVSAKLLELEAEREQSSWQIDLLNRKNIQLEELNEMTAKRVQLMENTILWKSAIPMRNFIQFFRKVFRKITIKFEASQHSNTRLTDITTNSDSYYDICISVIIPTYNGHEYMNELISTLNNQQGIKKIEIIIVDSESQDDTVEICKEFGVNLIEIKQTEFSHSYARNLGAKHATGDFLLFMTQDALPSNEFWIYNLATPLMKHDIVAASCLEIPRDNCEMAYRIESSYFAKYLGVSNADKIGQMPRSVNFESLRKNGQLNDVSCIIVKSVFDQFGYNGDYAEDLELGIKLIKSGHKIAILSSERVIHSHNRSVLYYFKRALVDSKNLLVILPDFPVYEQSTESLIDAVLFAYYKVVCILDQLYYNLPTQCTVSEMFSMITESINQLASIEQIEFSKFQFGKIYSDIKIDEFVNKLMEIVDFDYAQQGYLYNHIVHYINNNMAQFIKEGYKEIDSNSKEDVILTIYKRFVSVVGNEISLHLMTYNSSMELKDLVEDFYKGV